MSKPVLKPVVRSLVNIGGLVPYVFEASSNTDCSVPLEAVKDIPRVLDCAELFDTLLPVNKSTGMRESFQSAIRRLQSDPVKARLLDSVTEQLPVIDSVAGLSFDDKLASLRPVLDTGTSFDDEVWLNQVEDTLSSYLTPPVKESVKDPVQDPAPSE